MLLNITGAPARELLKTLKERVKPDKDLKEMGLTVYSSTDGLLQCDEADNTKAFCRIFLHAPQLKIEPALSCE